MKRWLSVALTFTVMNIQTYLYFEGTCERAIKLYQRALGMELVYLARFAEAPPELQTPGRGELIFHATVRLGETLLNMSDTMQDGAVEFGGFALLVHFDSEEKFDHAFDNLSAVGTVAVPAQSTNWAKRYAIVTDPFGVTWKLQFDPGS